MAKQCRVARTGPRIENRDLPPMLVSRDRPFRQIVSHFQRYWFWLLLFNLDKQSKTNIIAKLSTILPASIKLK
jgi:hypothetical protein